MAREDALDLRALAINARLESTKHLPTVLGARPLSSSVAWIDRDDRRPNAELFAAYGVGVLGVVAAIRKDAVETNEPRCLAHDDHKLPCVSAWPPGDGCADDEVGVRLAGDREFRPGRPMRSAPASLLDLMVVGADMADLEARAIDGRLRTPRD